MQELYGGGSRTGSHIESLRLLKLTQVLIEKDVVE